MKTPRHRISQTIADKALNATSSKKFAEKIAAYLLVERRTSELNSVLRDVQADWAAAGHVEVLAASAHPLSAAVRKDVEIKMRTVYPNAKTVAITDIIDPSVVGGVRISLANQQLDLSIQAKLHKFKQLTTAGKE